MAPSERELQSELRRACYEFAPRHPAKVEPEGSDWRIEVDDLGSLWIDEHGDDPRVVAQSKHIKKVPIDATSLRWRFAYGDHESLRQAVSHGVEHLLRAAPPNVRDK